MSSSSVLNSYNSEQPTLHQSNVKVQRISLKALSIEPIDWLWPLFMSISLIFILLGDIICFWLAIPLLLVLIAHQRCFVLTQQWRFLLTHQRRFLLTQQSRNSDLSVDTCRHTGATIVARRPICNCRKINLSLKFEFEIWVWNFEFDIHCLLLKTIFNVDIN